MCKHPSQNPQRNGHTLALKRSARLSLELQGVAQKVVAIDLGVDEAGLSRYLSPDLLRLKATVDALVERMGAL